MTFAVATKPLPVVRVLVKSWVAEFAYTRHARANRTKHQLGCVVMHTSGKSSNLGLELLQFAVQVLQVSANTMLHAFMPPCHSFSATVHFQAYTTESGTLNEGRTEELCVGVGSVYY